MPRPGPPPAPADDLVPALAQVRRHYGLIRDRSREGCFQAFRRNHWLGFTLFAGIVLAYGVR